MALVDRDGEHLKILSICYIAWAAWTGFMGLLMLPFFAFIAFLAAHPEYSSNRGDPPPVWLGAFMIGVGIVAAIFVLAVAALSYFCGRFLRERRHRTYCMIVAGLTCLSMPFGTVLGVSTIVVLEREEVRAMFTAGAVAPPPIPG